MNKAGKHRSRIRRSMERENSASLDMNPALWGTLPPSILNNIFARLPTRLAVRIRALSKSYKSLILDPKFARLHRSLAPSTLMLVTHTSSTKSQTGNDLIKCIDENGSQHVFQWDFLHLSSVFRRLQLVARASAAGFLCFSVGEKSSDPCEGPNVFYICNPITRQWRTFRLPSQVSDPLIVGMYFDAQTGSCKVIIVGANLSGRAFVYDGLGASWKEIASLPNLYAKASTPVSICGRLYWLVEETNVWGSGQQWAVGFDTEKEIWMEPICVSKEFVALCLGECDGKLVLLTMEESKSNELAFRVWNLDEKLKWAWEYTINMRVDDVNAPPSCGYCFYPTGGVVNGGVMWLTENRFKTVVKYDLRQETPLGSQTFVRNVAPCKLLLHPLGFEPTFNRLEDCINFNNCT